MKNKEIARLFYDVANAFEILGVEWKPRAYRKAAQSIDSMNEDIEEIYTKEGLKGLKKIPSIGDAMAHHLLEYFETGHVEKYNELFSQIPKFKSELLEIEGIGPKKVRQLSEELGINTIDDLKRALEKHEIAKLERFTDIGEERIRKAIERHEKFHQRKILSDVLPVAQELVNRLLSLPEVEKADYAGSLRRMKETIGDIDILATSKNPKKVMDYFSSMATVSEVLSKGKTKSTVFLREGIQVDLRIVESKSYGAAMQYFTGSKEHNVQLRTLAIKKGYKLSEYGLFDKNDKFIIGESEEEIYNKLGCMWIPPEMREAKGEIELALKDALPRLIEIEDIKGDFHIHTKYSDGVDSIETMIKAAQDRGYEYIAITDHSGATAIAGGLKPEEIGDEWREIDEVAKKYKVKILKSSEVDILKDGSLDYPDEILEKLDVVVGSVHSRFKMDRKEMTLRIKKALENPYLTILGHPTGRLLGKREPIDFDLIDIFKTASKNHKYLEINSQPHRLDLSNSNIIAAKKNGAKFVISTDAHNRYQLDFMKYGIAMARRGWLTKDDVLNTLSYEDLKKELKLK